MESTLTDVIYAIADRYARRTLFRVSAITALICRPTGMWCLSALTNPLYPGHQPARRRRRLLENSGDDRANLAGALPARRPP
ncbi:hypothetical protein LNQ03_02195 [Klebsiella pneumoniae subsp. pneumoniae]|nr:hypothetical protein [Klebsiella pneumoniae subsp. pneumoniae]